MTSGNAKSKENTSNSGCKAAKGNAKNGVIKGAQKNDCTIDGSGRGAILIKAQRLNQPQCGAGVSVTGSSWAASICKLKSLSLPNKNLNFSNFVSPRRYWQLLASMQLPMTSSLRQMPILIAEVCFCSY